MKSFITGSGGVAQQYCADSVHLCSVSFGAVNGFFFILACSKLGQRLLPVPDLADAVPGTSTQISFLFIVTEIAFLCLSSPLLC